MKSDLHSTRRTSRALPARVAMRAQREHYARGSKPLSLKHLPTQTIDLALARIAERRDVCLRLHPSQFHFSSVGNVFMFRRPRRRAEDSSSHRRVVQFSLPCQSIFSTISAQVFVYTKFRSVISSHFQDRVNSTATLLSPRSAVPRRGD